MSKKTHALSQYKLPDKPKELEHSFTAKGVYLNYGHVKTYANKTQCQNRINLLKSLGFECFMSFDHPFIILKTDNTYSRW